MLEVKNIKKQYEGKPLLCGVSFRVGADETVCLLGRSGGGKSTILRIIAGLEIAEDGQVFWNGQDISQVPAHRRGFGFMFQDYALFPHLNVFENIAYGLRVQKMPDEQIRLRVSEVLDMVGMGAFEKRAVIDLSGGEKQRIAFARAIAPWPKLLMLDEPMGALDRTLRDQLLGDLMQLLRVTDIPVIYVTHDQEEAFAVADRIMILHDGRIIQSGAPQEVYSRPIDLYTASFLGLKNRLLGTVTALDPFTVDTPIGSVRAACIAGEKRVGDGVELLLTDISIAQKDADRINCFPARVVAQHFQGRDFQLKLRVADIWDAVITSDKSLPEGQDLIVAMPPESIQCYSKGEAHEDCQE